MNILLVNGSPHKNGNTATALAEIAKTLESDGLTTETFWIGAKPVHGCMACGACMSKCPGRCIFNDDPCNELIERFAAADGIVLSAPVYYGQPNGALLALTQRAFFAGRGNVEGKPAATVAVCRRAGSTAAFQCLNMPFQMLNCPLATSQYWNIAFGRAPGEAAQDVEGMQTMRTLARNLAWMVRNLRGENALPRPEREPWQPMHFIR